MTPDDPEFRGRAIKKLILIAVLTFVVGHLIGDRVQDCICSAGLSAFWMNFVRPIAILTFLGIAFWSGFKEQTRLYHSIFFVSVTLFLIGTSVFNGANFEDMHISQSDFEYICKN